MSDVLFVTPSKNTFSLEFTLSEKILFTVKKFR